MSALNPPRNISKRQELRQDTVVTFYAKAWDYFEHNRSVVFGALGALVVLVLLVVGYSVYQANQGEKAQEQLGGIVSVYEAGSYREALDGTAEQAGLLAIADDFGGTDAGNLAHFYAADALFRLGEYDAALEHFKAFDKEENFIGASAIAGEAAIYEIQGDFNRAADRYMDAATLYENDLRSPEYLLKAGRAYEEAGELNDAYEAYETIQETYPESAVAQEVDFYLARVAAKRSA